MTAAQDLPEVLLLSGPNLNLLGTRQPEIYGSATLADHVGRAARAAQDNGLRLRHEQSGSEAEMVAAVHRARGTSQAIVINAGALTHYSWSLSDALATYEGPVIEVHISHPESREQWRHTSVIAPVVAGTITGLGGLGYELAVTAVAQLLFAPR